MNKKKRYANRLFISILCIASLTVSSARATATETSGWLVGFASTNITPTTPIRMAGYASDARKQRSQGVASDLFAKAMAIEDRTGNRALLITTDLIGFTSATSEPIYKRITAATGLSRRGILINSSHTHTGPAIGLDKSNIQHLGNPDHISETLAYSTGLADQIVRLATEATEALQPANISWSVGVAPFVMNRREFTERGVRLGVNPRGLVDRSVPVMKIASDDGTVRGAVFGTACHNTTLGSRDMKISGDYAGYAQLRIEKQLGNAQAMFVQGCGGDANPYPRESEEVARVHGMTLGDEVLRVLDTKCEPVAGPLTTLLARVSLPLQQDVSSETFQKLELASGATRNVAKELREKKEADGSLPASYQSDVALWQFGNDLTLVALPGEVVAEYVRLIEDEIGPRKLWVSAYNHDVFGYLPSARVLAEGGYEMRGIYSGGFGIFSRQAEDRVVNVVRRLAAKAGRVP